jgi:2-iminobutanoate/2-iminopropanoate deaminase
MKKNPLFYGMKKSIASAKAPSPIGPYSQAVRFGQFLFTSGQIAIDPATQVYIPAPIEVEARLVMENLKALLDAAAMGFPDVVKTTIFLADMNDFAKVNEIYASYFQSDFPARETVQVSVLPKHAKVEISMIAASRAPEQTDTSIGS